MKNEATIQGEPILGISAGTLQTATATIVAALLQTQPGQVKAGDLPAIIASVQGALAADPAEKPEADPAAEIEKPTPKQIKASIGTEGIVSFIDGKSYKTLKRHLTTHGLDPRAYRARYGLPDDYPMVAPSYSAQRSTLAKNLGLGRAAPAGANAAA